MRERESERARSRALVAIQMFHPTPPTWSAGGGDASSCGSLPRNKTGHKAINESVNKWKDMDERLNRNRSIPLSTLTEVDIHFKWFTAIISGIEFQVMMEESTST